MRSLLDAVVKTTKIFRALQVTRGGPSHRAGTVWFQFGTVYCPGQPLSTLSLQCFWKQALSLSCVFLVRHYRRCKIKFKNGLSSIKFRMLIFKFNQKNLISIKRNGKNYCQLHKKVVWTEGDSFLLKKSFEKDKHLRVCTFFGGKMGKTKSHQCPIFLLP